MSRYLIFYRSGLPPVESNICWVDLLDSKEYKELLAEQPSKEKISIYPWTREFAVSLHKHKLWERYSYTQEGDSRKIWWPKDPKTFSQAKMQKNLDLLKKTESSSALRAAARQKRVERDLEIDWEWAAAGLNVWPDILDIAPKLKAYVNKENI